MQLPGFTMNEWQMGTSVLAIMITFVLATLTSTRKYVGSRALPWIMVACAAVWVLNAGLNNIGQQLRRQAVATEKSVKLTEEQSEALQSLDGFLKQLAGTPPTNEAAASSPKK